MGIAGDYVVHDVMKIEELPDGSVLVHCLSVEPSSGSGSVEYYPMIVNPCVAYTQGGDDKRLIG